MLRLSLIHICWVYPEEEIKKMVESLEDKDKVYIKILSYEFENEYVSFRICLLYTSQNPNVKLAAFDAVNAQPVDLTQAAETSLHAVVHIRSTPVSYTHLFRSQYCVTKTGRIDCQADNAIETIFEVEGQRDRKSVV